MFCDEAEVDARRCRSSLLGPRTTGRDRTRGALGDLHWAGRWFLCRRTHASFGYDGVRHRVLASYPQGRHGRGCAYPVAKRSGIIAIREGAPVTRRQSLLLQPHLTTSMFLASNLLAHGLFEREHRHGTEYWIVEEGKEIQGIVRQCLRAISCAMSGCRGLGVAGSRTGSKAESSME